MYDLSIKNKIKLYDNSCFIHEIQLEPHTLLYFFSEMLRRNSGARPYKNNYNDRDLDEQRQPYY